MNDLVVDNKNGFVYIADSGIYTDPLEGGLIVYNMRTKQFRRVLLGFGKANVRHHGRDSDLFRPQIHPHFAFRSPL